MRMLSTILYISWSDIPWNVMLWPELTWVEKIVRPFLVYLILLVIFRIANKRDMAQATLFDFLIILLISNVVQNAMIGNDNSILGATAGAVTLIFLSGAFNFVAARSRNARDVLEGQPVLLVEQGKINDEMMEQQKITRSDLLAAIRKQGIIRIAEVAYAVLEIDGSISVIKTDDNKQPHDCLPVEIAGRESADKD
ncbi:MAG TPA: YetF domain-containing protein [Pyrinomonadaceae bacterium]|jgi:uncharacterized membrane protein YcaP (DUF421 family)|nr:YetF domain-containing protein [Pyrinomonadaceae bacterium]